MRAFIRRIYGTKCNKHREYFINIIIDSKTEYPVLLQYRVLFSFDYKGFVYFTSPSFKSSPVRLMTKDTTRPMIKQEIISPRQTVMANPQ